MVLTTTHLHTHRHASLPGKIVTLELARWRLGGLEKDDRRREVVPLPLPRRAATGGTGDGNAGVVGGDEDIREGAGGEEKTLAWNPLTEKERQQHRITTGVTSGAKMAEIVGAGEGGGRGRVCRC